MSTDLKKTAGGWNFETRHYEVLGEIPPDKIGVLLPVKGTTFGAIPMGDVFHRISTNGRVIKLEQLNEFENQKLIKQIVKPKEKPRVTTPSVSD